MELPIETRKSSKLGLFFIAATGSLYVNIVFSIELELIAPLIFVNCDINCTGFLVLQAELRQRLASCAFRL